MERRTIGIIATVASAILCGCSGLFAVFFGGISALASLRPGANINVFGSSAPLTTGIIAICGGLIFIAIPIAIGFFTLRRRPDSSDMSKMDEPSM